MQKLCLASFIWIFSVTQVLAVSVSILSSPASIGEEKFSITVKTEGASAGTNYLRTDLYSEGSKNYFGETDSGQAWYNGSDGKQYFPITIINNTTTIATLSARLGEPSLSDYPGPGNYKLRIRRYTSSGGQGSEDAQPVDIAITKIWPSPSPSPTATPTPTPSPTPVQTATPTPTPVSSPTPTPKPSPRPSPSPQISSEPVGTVAGTTTEIDLSGFGVSPSSSPVEVDLRVDPNVKVFPMLNHSRAKTVLLIGIGVLLISIAGLLHYRRIIKI